MLRLEQGSLVELFLIDFGFALKTSEDTRNMLDYCGTPNYMSPELVSKNHHSLAPNDMWALGVILYRLTVGCFPFPKNNFE